MQDEQRHKNTTIIQQKLITNAGQMTMSKLSESLISYKKYQDHHDKCITIQETWTICLWETKNTADKTWTQVK